MTKILIVDDEYIIRDGIANSIDWQAYAVQIVGEASDCDEAYDKYLETTPDIIIMDIRMGKDSGLDLAKKIRITDKTTQIIILSGYQEFEYAKSAIESNVCAYLLKPIRNEQLIDAVLHAQKELKKSKSDIVTIKNYAENLPVIIDKFLADLINLRYDSEKQINDKLKQFGINFKYTKYLPIVIKLDGIATLDKKENIRANESAYMAIQNTIERNKINAVNGFYDGSHFIIMSVNDDFSTAISRASLNHSLHDFQIAIKNNCNMSSSIGTGNVYDSLSGTSAAYNQALSALNHRVILGNSHIINYTDTPSNSATDIVAIPINDIEKIINSINEVDYCGAKETVTQIFENIRNRQQTDINAICDAISEMLILIFHRVFKNELQIAMLFGQGFKPSMAIRNLETVSDIEKRTMELLNKIFENPNIYLKCPYHPEIQQAISIIMKKYQLPITVKSVAAELLISPDYFMHLFKKETSKSFNTYLTEYRVNMAIKFMKSGKYKIYEISEMVGYQNPRCFSQVFKKVTGKTPKKFINE